MPRKFMDNKTTDAPLRFKSEAEEADWWASPAGRRYASRGFQQKFNEGKLIVSEKTTMDKNIVEEMKRTGSMVYFKNGLKVKRTDPADIQELTDRMKAKQTQAVSLRIPIADLEAAKKIAGKAGIGYQTLLKDLIHEGLRRTF